VRSAVVKRGNFSAVREHCPPEKPFVTGYLLFAIAILHLLPFSSCHWLQWLMTKFLSAEFIRRLKVVDWRVVLPHDRNFRQRRSAALQRNHSPIAIRHSPFTIRHSPIAVVLARQEPRLLISFRPASLAPRPVPFLSRVPCPVPRSKSALNFCVINY